MWQDVSLAVDHEHASELVSTILDVPGAPKSSNLPCQPQAKRKQAKWKEATMQGWPARGTGAHRVTSVFHG